MRLHMSHIRFKLSLVNKVASMSKRRKDEALHEVLWVPEHIDLMTPSDSFEIAAMPREQAEARCAELAGNGTRETSKDKSTLGYYQLRQQTRVK